MGCVGFGWVQMDNLLSGGWLGFAEAAERDGIRDRTAQVRQLADAMTLKPDSRCWLGASVTEVGGADRLINRQVQVFS